MKAGLWGLYTYFISICSHTYRSPEEENPSHSEPDAGHKFIKMNEAAHSPSVAGG